MSVITLTLIILVLQALARTKVGIVTDTEHNGRAPVL